MNKKISMFSQNTSSVASFSKEYVADTKEELIYKLQLAKKRVCEQLANLDIIPVTIKISEDNQFFQLPNGRFAIKISFNLVYHCLKDKTFEESKSICEKIHSEQHHMKYFASHPRPLKGTRYVYLRNLQFSHITIKASSSQEMVSNMRNAILGLIKEKGDEQFNTDIEIKNLSFEKTVEGKYLATYLQEVKTAYPKRNNQETKICNDEER